MQTLGAIILVALFGGGGGLMGGGAGQLGRKVNCPF